MTRKRHISIVTGLLGLSCLIQFVVISRATVTALDAVRFAGLAQQIDRQGLLPTVRAEGEQPLFPAWVWLVHEGLHRVTGEFPSIWATSTQLAAAIPLVLAVVPLYLALMRLVGTAAATAGSFFFCLLPEVSRLGADGISDSTHLLFFCLAFWAAVEYFSERPGEDSPWRPAWLLVAGAATAMALLARAEVLVLAGALVLVLALASFQLLPGRRQAYRGLVAATACFVLGLVVVLGPYFVAVGVTKPRSAVDCLLGRRQVKAEPAPSAAFATASAWRLADGEPMSFDAKERSVSIRRRGYPAAIGLFGTKLADAFGYWIGALAVFGAWRLRRIPASGADRFVQIFFLLFSLIVIRFTAVEGYLQPRHLLALVVVGLGSAGYGALQLAGSARGSRMAWLPVVLAGVACLPQTLVRHHHSRLGHSEAGRWLAGQGDASGAVLDTRGWAGLYSGRNTYRFEQAPAALSDPHLAYLVVERQELDYDSGRSRTLRRLIETAGDAVAEFPHPAVRRPEQRPVVVDRWYRARHATNRPSLRRR